MKTYAETIADINNKNNNKIEEWAMFTLLKTVL